MSTFTCRKLLYYTKNENKLIAYAEGTAVAHMPVVMVYEHTGSEEEALKAFLPLKSFSVVHTGDSYLAFPLKGIGKVRIPGQKLLYRYENGKPSHLEDACKICKDRVKNLLSGCSECNSLEKVPQLNPMRPIRIKQTRLEHIDDNGDTRTAYTRDADKERKSYSALLK